MAEKVRVMPVQSRKQELNDTHKERLGRRRAALDAVRKQARYLESRLRFDMFNTWRTGEGTMKAIAEAAGYSEYWVQQLIERIKENDALLEAAIDDYLAEHPDAKL